MNRSSSRPLSRIRARAFAALLPLCAMFLNGCAIEPAPFAAEEHLRRAAEDKEALYAGQEALAGPLTLDMAIARALKYNYDHRLAVMEAAFHNQELTAATYAMLPKLAANAGYADRDNESASSSISYKTRSQTLEPSVSSERERRTADLTLTWTTLDFGLSYFQAKQQGDRLLIGLERKRRVMNNIVKEVIGAYWKAHIAEKLLPIIDDVLAEAEKHLATYRRLHELRLASPLETLEQHRDLLFIVNQLKRLKADMAMSRIKLAALINIPVDAPYSVAPPAPFMLTPPPLSASVGELENRGLSLRSDLREEAYQERIDKAEVYKEIIRMLPGVSLFAGVNYDANRFLANQHWQEAGARVTMNLFDLISGPKRIKAAETRAEVAHTRRLALTVAAIVQINLSYHQYQQAAEEFKFASEISGLEQEIHKLANSEYSTDAGRGLTLIRHSVNAVRTEIERNQSLADLYYHWGNLYFSLGGDMVPVFFENEDLAEMARVIHDRMDIWWKGELP